MKLTLRKANALQLLINESIASTSISTQVSVSKYDDPVQAVLNAAAIFQASLAKTRSLLSVLYSIREKVADAGHKAGVSKILSEIAHTEKMAAVLKPLASLSSFALTEEVLREAHADLKKDQGAAASYSRRDSFTTGAIPQGWLPSYVKEVSDLRKKKQSLSDKLLEINVSNFIELSEEEEAVLKQYDLI